LRRLCTRKHHARTCGRRIRTFEGAFRTRESQEFSREHRPSTDDVGSRAQDTQPIARNRRRWTRHTWFIAGERQEITCGRCRMLRVRQRISRDRQDSGRAQQ
jgi:hypothetical protein